MDHLVGEDQFAEGVYFDGGSCEIFGGFEVENVTFRRDHLDTRTRFISGGLSELRTSGQGYKKDKSFKRFHFDFCYCFLCSSIAKPMPMGKMPYLGFLSGSMLSHILILRKVIVVTCTRYSH